MALQMLVALATVSGEEPWRQEIQQLQQQLLAQQQQLLSQQQQLDAVRAEMAKQPAGAALPGQALGTNEASVDVRGATGRKLQTGSVQPECCRWTPDDTCGSVDADKFYKCSMLHEFWSARPSRTRSRTSRRAWAPTTTPTGIGSTTA